ncbi:NAD(P)-binding domain-containing protein [Cupriavidus basilensis]
MEQIDVLVIGGGQSGLAVGYFLRRTTLSFVILDSEPSPGAHGNTPGTLCGSSLRPSGVRFPVIRCRVRVMTPTPPKTTCFATSPPMKSGMLLPVKRPVVVQSVARDGERMIVQTDSGSYAARAVVSATGTWRHPFWPHYPGAADFHGVQLHSAHYRSADAFAGKRVLVVGGGNSGAQILAEVSQVADTVWATKEPPLFYPTTWMVVSSFLGRPNDGRPR